jgi:uncharacterized membrane protein (DUF373 family)
MSEHTNEEVAKESNQTDAVTTSTVDPHQIATHNGRRALEVGRLLEQGDSIVYAIVGFCFILGAVLALGYTFWNFANGIGTILSVTPEAGKPDERPGVFASTIITLISDLLLVLIIMEVLSTVIEYLKAHITTLTPFLSIGIISATRGVLSIGARLSVGQLEDSQSFLRSMIELGINAFAILALGLTLALLTRTASDKQQI